MGFWWKRSHWICDLYTVFTICIGQVCSEGIGMSCENGWVWQLSSWQALRITWTFRSCGNDIEFSINVEYNSWWLVVNRIILQGFFYPRWCRDLSIKSIAQFLGITCTITWIAWSWCFTPRSISSVLLSVLWLWRLQVWPDVWIVWWWGSWPFWKDTLWIWVNGKKTLKWGGVGV